MSAKSNDVRSTTLHDVATDADVDYPPNVLARSLRQQSHNTVGVLAAELVQGIESVLLENGFDCFLIAWLRNIKQGKSALPGHQKIGLLGASIVNGSSLRRFTGYIEANSSTGLNRSVRQLTQRSRPTAVFWEQAGSRA